MSKKKILYVEDDETLAFLTVDSLTTNYEVYHYANGKEGFDAFCNDSFDLCILDVMLPEMDGFELATAIRKRNMEVPILFLSAKTMKEDRIKGLKIGADDYVVKPYSIEELTLKMEVFLLRSQKTMPKKTTYQVGSYEFDPTNYLLKNQKTAVNLTEREAGLLKLFLDHKNIVLKREKILLDLWGSDDYFLGRSLDVFISRLRKILKDESDIQIENIPRIGFKMVIK
jgi:DNA-binding response OmpR family regulator